MLIKKEKNNKIRISVFILLLLICFYFHACVYTTPISKYQTVFDDLPYKSIHQIKATAYDAQKGGVQVYTSQMKWKHWNFEMRKDYSIKPFGKRRFLEEKKFKIIIIENKWLKVSLLPQVGGRILSIIYKPTSHELLYQETVGVPYGNGQGYFFYDWLMLYGGIYPTFPEPEHGKGWFLPWKTKIITNNTQYIAVQMSLTDTIKDAYTTPPTYNNGITGITCTAVVRLHKDRSFVELDVKVKNNENDIKQYEYWTCCTFSPGSKPGRSYSPINTELLIPSSMLHLRNDYWEWMGKSETFISNHSSEAGGIYNLKNLKYYSNWKSMGIAYAYPKAQKNWWGAINQNNKVGILRIADNNKATPGFKLWTWGINKYRPKLYQQKPITKRPFIEMWAGHSLEFFKDAYLDSYEEKIWPEFFIPIIGLSKITDANEHAAVYLSYTRNKTQQNFKAILFTTQPENHLQVKLLLIGKKNYTLKQTIIKSNPKSPHSITIAYKLNQFAKGKYKYKIEIYDKKGKTLLMQTHIPYEKK